MRIVTTANNDEHIVGITSTLSACNLNPVYWNKQIKPVFDMFDEIRPELLICKSQEIDTAVIQAIQEYGTKLIVFGIYVNSSLSPDLICYPNEIKPELISKLHKSSCPYLQLQKAANVAKYYNGRVSEKYRSDALYISDNPEAVINNLTELDSISQQCALKAVGPIKLPISAYLGNANLQEICDMIKSTEIGIDVGNTHMYDFLINKTFCVTTSQQDIMPHISEISKYIGQPKLRKKIVGEVYRTIKDQHTYFHRTKEVFEAIGEHDICKHIMDTLESKLHD